MQGHLITIDISLPFNADRQDHQRQHRILSGRWTSTLNEN